MKWSKLISASEHRTRAFSSEQSVSAGAVFFASQSRQRTGGGARRAAKRWGTRAARCGAGAPRWSRGTCRWSWAAPGGPAPLWTPSRRWLPTPTRPAPRATAAAPPAPSGPTCSALCSQFEITDLRLMDTENLVLDTYFCRGGEHSPCWEKQCSFAHRSKHHRRDVQVIINNQ